PRRPRRSWPRTRCCGRSRSHRCVASPPSRRGGSPAAGGRRRCRCAGRARNGRRERSGPPMQAAVVELTTVADDAAVVHRRVDGRASEVRTYDELRPDTSYELDGVAFRTLPRPGELLAVFATVNDVHFGEVECGRL